MKTGLPHVYQAAKILCVRRWPNNLTIRVIFSLAVSQSPADLMPMFVLEGRECVMETPKLAAIPARLLRTPVENLSGSQLEIGAALDFLCHGF